MFDNNLRMATAEMVGWILDPLIGFNGTYPILTLLCAGIIMTGISTLLRHFNTDWVETARSQKIMGVFNKELRKAQMNQNANKIKKLKEIQPEMMQKQMKTSKSQMKLMPVTMLIVIPIFAWIGWYFIPGLSSKIISVPWAFNVSLTSVTVLWHWILLYSMFSIPFQQVLQGCLKLFTFKRKLDALEFTGD
jgi:uncharacterized membrane protein (DUF106 family)